MAITKPSLRMPCTGPITIAGILTLHGRHTSSSLSRGHGPPLLTMSTTNIRSRIHGELHRINYNQASLLEGDTRGKIDTGFKAEKVIVGVVVSLCVIGAMSRRYEAQIMSPMPNFASMSQVFENFMGTKRDKPISPLKELDTLIQEGISRSKGSPNAQKTPSEIQLEQVKIGSGQEYISGLKEIDDLIGQKKFIEAEKKCKTLKESPSIVISEFDGSIAIREFIALIGQAKVHLENYINETKSLQHLEKHYKQMNHLIQKATQVVIDEFKTDDSKNATIECKIDAVLKELIEGKDSFLKFMDKMRSAEEKLKEYKAIEECRRDPSKCLC